MDIRAITLHCDSLEAQRRFYEGVLGLPAKLERDGLTVTVGASELRFRQQVGFTGQYHFAFTIPRNQFQIAATWLEKRTPLIPDATGQTRFPPGEWNAENVYFYDPQGNIVELIARHELENDKHFGGLLKPLCISEIGLSFQDVLGTIRWFADTLGVGTYKSFSDTFAPIGDAHGLVIAVREGRTWFPDTGVPAQALPTELTIKGSTPTVHAIPGTPYTVRVIP